VTRRLRTLALHAGLVAAAVLTLLPLVWMLAASFLPSGASSEVVAALASGDATLANYETLFGRLDLARTIANSAGLALAVTAISLTVNTMAGYAFAKLRFAGRDRIFRGLLATLVIPGQIGMLPLFLLLKELGLVNTYAGVLIPGIASVFGIFLVRQYALSIPQSLLDAARVDGAGEARIFVQVVLPLLRPILVTLAIFTFLGTWNDFLWPLVVLTDDRLYTLPVALANLLGEHVQDVELVMAGAVITVAPVVVLFAALQRYYLQGIVTSGLRE
jgi:multiple sugar transport system permease protein